MLIKTKVIHEMKVVLTTVIFSYLIELFCNQNAFAVTVESKDIMFVYISWTVFGFFGSFTGFTIFRISTFSA
jgi:hypothetical protein